MEEAGFPGHATTTTTVTSSNTTVQTNIRYDPSYFRSVPGILKCVQIVADLLVFICISFSAHRYSGVFRFMSFICGFGFWLTGVLLLFYIFHIIEKYFKIPWLKVELGYCGLWTLFLLIGSTISTVNIGYAGIFGAVAFFGYVGMIVYGYDSFLKFRALQNGEIAQGERQVTKNVNVNSTSPTAY